MAHSGSVYNRQNSAQQHALSIEASPERTRGGNVLHDGSVSDGPGLLPMHRRTQSGNLAEVHEKGEAFPTRTSRVSKYANAIPVQKPPMTVWEKAHGYLQDDRLMLVVYTLLSIITHWYRIGSNHKVVWDEAHFGKFGSYYIRHKFYFDVHPPLGKILVSLAGFLSGFDGNFEFESGHDYPKEVPFIKMRLLMSIYGILMVPVAYLTAQSMHWDWRTKHLFTLMVLLDNGWLTITRFILLDSMLLLFTLCVVLGLVRFHRTQSEPFTKSWWFWLFFTGASIGCVSSVKMVGLFATSLVGLYTMEDLWAKFGDLKMPVRTYLRHWCARLLALVIVPLSIYTLSFKLHFAILYKTGPGDAQMSSLFQSNLQGSELAEYPIEAAYGSKLTMKNMGYGGGLLHSHIQKYPEGSGEQQVTCYHYKDHNNHFVIQSLYEEPALPGPNDTDVGPPRMLKSGDVFRFSHVETGRNLRAHKKFKAPVTKDHYEVSAAGNLTHGLHTDYWIAEVLDDMQLGKGKKGAPVRTLTSRLRFKNKQLGCYLRAGHTVLPDWGWKQLEVACDPHNNPNDEFTYWNIENHWNPRLKSSSKEHFRSPFFKDFVHLNVAMMISNNALIPDADKADALASKPLEWPWMWRGMRMNGWGPDQDKYYLIGNAFVWWGSTFSLYVVVAMLTWYILRRQRRIFDMSPVVWDDFLFGVKVGLIGWILHYLPFLVMGRVTYIHHYLPTLYFAVIVFAHMLDHFLWNDATARYRFDLRHLLRTGQISSGKHNVEFQEEDKVPCRGTPLSESTKNLLFLGLAALLFGIFWWFRAVSFGMSGDIHKWHGLKWRKHWNIY
ncbi:dolichyl-phosphate-mannose--protein mannosyltransferase [Malassezia psittaci]|uniref:Dolichyl-phosphate-mannose--protein mannosyltransferase n=1 Tax=Malassezia psittaci TaxID=1821823 RepID=A0AAF0F8A5_9BASI|nr:dolichyl-phosphate-mannose--protein mannosyltransferase [Malassezia psittaci]